MPPALLRSRASPFARLSPPRPQPPQHDRPPALRPTVPANQGVNFRPHGGTPAYNFTDSQGVLHDGYPVDIAATTNAGNPLAERVYVVVNY